MAVSKRRIRFVLWGLVVLALVGVFWLRVVVPRFQEEVTLRLGTGDYQLSTTDGSFFTEASLKGAPSAVFFGYTHCPDVCPTTLGDIATWQEALAQEDRHLRVFFVTVDPARDTVDALRDYVSWVPGVIGVSGPQAEIDKALKAFRVYARQVPLTEGDYSMDHSSMVLLFDRNGQLSEPIGYQEEEARVLAKLDRLFRK